MTTFEGVKDKEPESSNADSRGPYDIFFGDGIEGRGLDYFTDYEPAFAIVDSNINAILERILDEFGPLVENSGEQLHVAIDRAHIYGDAQFIMEECTEDAIWRGANFGYNLAKQLSGHKLK